MRLSRFFIAAILMGIAVFSIYNMSGIKPNISPDQPRSFSSQTVVKTQSLQGPTALELFQSYVDNETIHSGTALFLRIIKSPDGVDRTGYVEAYAENKDGKFIRLKRWDICTWSGTLGPKFKEGDGQSPEGFYFVRASQMNPHSSYHLSFNLGYPNQYDREKGYTGSYLMVHGDCVSIGCYAMTDEGIEDIYSLMEHAFGQGQAFIRVHIFPFPMTEANLEAFKDNPHYAFWQNLKEGWDWFESHKSPPDVYVDDGEYRFQHP